MSQIFIYSPLCYSQTPCLTVVIDQDALHLDCPLTHPDLASPRPVPISITPLLPLQTLFVVYSKICLAQALQEVFCSSLSCPILHQSKPSWRRRLRRFWTIEPFVLHASARVAPQGEQARRPHLAKACRASSHRGLVHSTSPRYHSSYPHPSSHTRNLGRNMKVSQFIKQKTGAYRSGQISSHIQVLRSL